MTDSWMIYVTVPDAETGVELARTLVGERLAACGNLIPGIRSIYRWKGEICDDGELLLLLKSTASRFDALRDRVVALHPYDCPEVLAVPVVAGHPEYLDWLAAQTEG